MGIENGPSNKAKGCKAHVSGKNSKFHEASKPVFPHSLEDDYEALYLVAEGGMGRVWAAKRKADARKVAIKVILPHLIEEEAYLERFQREASIGSQIEHRGLAKILDSRVEGGQSFLVSDFIEGKSLYELLQSQNFLPPKQVVKIATAISKALSQLHQKGLIHRDIKPENIIESPKRGAVLVDFGLARSLERGSTVTKTGVIIGTPDYMAPEVCQGRAAMPSSDIFSLGVTLLQCLKGLDFLPSRGQSAMEVLGSRSSGVNIPKRLSFQDGIEDDALLELIERALAFDAAKRFTDGQAMEQFIRLRYQGPSRQGPSRQGSAQSEPTPDRMGVRERRSRKGLFFTIVLACLCLYLLKGPLFNGSAEENSGVNSSSRNLPRLRQRLLKEGGEHAKERLRTFARKLEAPSNKASYSSYRLPYSLEMLQPRDRARLYLAKFLEKSWIHRERDHQRQILAQRSLEFYLALLEEQKRVSLTPLLQGILHSCDRASLAAANPTPFARLLSSMDSDGTASILIDFYRGKALFIEASCNDANRESELSSPPRGFLEAEKFIRPVIEDFASEDSSLDFLHLDKRAVIGLYGDIHGAIRTKDYKRVLIDLTEKLTESKSPLKLNEKVCALRSAQSALLKENRSKDFDVVDQTLDPKDLLTAETFVRKALELNEDREREHLLYFELSNVLRHRTKYEESLAALDRVDFELLKGRERFAYSIKRGYILQGLGLYGEAIESFGKAVSYAESEGDKAHARQQERKALLLKDFREGKLKLNVDNE